MSFSTATGVVRVWEEGEGDVGSRIRIIEKSVTKGTVQAPFGNSLSMEANGVVAGMRDQHSRSEKFVILSLDAGW